MSPRKAEVLTDSQMGKSELLNEHELQYLRKP